MTDTDPGIEALRALHEPTWWKLDPHDRCRRDGHPWPCPTARLFAERDALKAALSGGSRT